MRCDDKTHHAVSTNQRGRPSLKARVNVGDFVTSATTSIATTEAAK
jgi:hypothetical protein